MKFFKRLGAAIGVMALLAVGLVGVAAPAQATGHGDREKCAAFNNSQGQQLPDDEVRAKVTAECAAKGYTDIMVFALNGDGVFYDCPGGGTR